MCFRPKMPVEPTKLAADGNEALEREGAILKIPREKSRTGSIPVSGTTITKIGSHCPANGSESHFALLEHLSSVAMGTCQCVLYL